jgi:8-oxo-dGTP diphosphatase
VCFATVLPGEPIMMKLEPHTVTIKIIFFTVQNGVLRAYLPGNSIPGSLLGDGRSLEEETGELIRTTLKDKGNGRFVEQLYTVLDEKAPDRVVIVYYLLVPSGDISDMENWTPVFDIPDRFHDTKILSYAIQRLQWKIEYTNVVYSLLPKRFTLGELQRVYEAILHKTLDKRNFRKKILSLHIIRDTGTKKKLGRARPAEVYTFTTRKPSFVGIL